MSGSFYGRPLEVAIKDGALVIRIGALHPHVCHHRPHPTGKGRGSCQDTD